MKKILSGCLVIMSTVNFYAQQDIVNAHFKADPVVQTKAGFVQGKAEDGFSTFKGIPYATAPVGDFRWRPPQAVKPWEGVRPALAYGPDCAQGGWGTAPGKIRDGSSEDCLYLNLWVPARASQQKNLPVMVWIHGGGFVGGSGSDILTSGDAFARMGVILVTFNYRLGRLGHFVFPALTEEYPDEPKGSYAFMDMIAALKWVQENIASFGGDPDNVTIFGQSAGGVAVHALLTIPQARGLFHKAISQSGGGRDGVLTGRPIKNDHSDSLYLVSAETIGVIFARKHGIAGTDAAALDKLRWLSVEEIVDGGQENDGQGGPRIYSGPILDGTLVAETAESAYNAERQAKIPLIIGSNSAEIGGNFVNSSNSKEALFSLFGELKTEANTAYDPEGNRAFADVISRFNTDWVWAEPARFVAKSFVHSEQPAYIYRFGFVPSNLQERMPFGAGHGMEIAYVFNQLHARWGTPDITPDDEKIARIMNAYWVNFARTGNPNGEGLPEWPVYDLEKEKILEIKADGEIKGIPDPLKARLDLIEKAFKFRYRIQSRGGI